MLYFGLHEPGHPGKICLSALTKPIQKSDAETEALGRSRGGFSSKITVVTDALGNPLVFPGQRHDTRAS